MIDAKLKLIIEKFDEIGRHLNEVRDYNRTTALIVMVLWGLGLPLSFMIALNIAVRL